MAQNGVVVTGQGDEARDYVAEKEADERLAEYERREAEKEEKKQ